MHEFVNVGWTDWQLELLCVLSLLLGFLIGVTFMIIVVERMLQRDAQLSEIKWIERLRPEELYGKHDMS